MLKFNPVQCAVEATSLSMDATESAGSMSYCPRMLIWTLFSISSSSSDRTYLTINLKMPETSSVLRFQFSVENAYTVRF